jgi:hypothetical protein
LQSSAWPFLESHSLPPDPAFSFEDPEGISLLASGFRYPERLDLHLF